MNDAAPLMNWLGLAPFVWGWIFAALAIAAAVATLLLPSIDWLADEYRYQAWSSRKYFVAAAIVVGLLLHLPGFFGAFDINDDFDLIAGDRLLTDLSLTNLQALAATNFHHTLQTLGYVTAALNWALAGDTYWPWYLFNWLLLIPILVCIARLTWHFTGDTRKAALSTALFAATPVVAETLCWINLRGDWLGLGFALISCVAYLEYRWCSTRRNPAWFALSVVCFGFTLLAPGSYSFLPLWLLLFDLWARRRDWITLLTEKLPYCLLALWSQYRSTDLPGMRYAEPLGGNYWNTVLLDFNLLVEYLRALFVPVATGLEPPLKLAQSWLSVTGYSTVTSLGFAPLASLIILVAAVAAVIGCKRRHGWSLPSLCLPAIFVSLLPALNIPSHGLAGAFEYRYSLAAHVISAILLADLFCRLWQWKPQGSARYLGFGVVGAYLVWAVSATLTISSVWRDPTTYWQWMTESYPASYNAFYRAGKLAQQKSDHGRAVEYLQQALTVNFDGEFEVYRRLGDSLYFLDDYAGAKEHWRRYFTEHPYEITDKVRRRFAEVGLQLLEKSTEHGP